MWSPVLSAVLLLACDVTFSAAQKARSCRGECGAEYYRGYTCQCDYNCLSYGECCKDFESLCTTKDSCKGRCGESFRRGRLCSCDSDCDKYKQCCSDFKLQCDEEAEISGAANAAPVKTNSCDNVNDYKPKDPTEVTEPSTFNEGNTEDEYGQIFPNDEVSDLEADLVPETTASYGSTTADQSSAEPTADPDPLEVSTETFPVDDATTEEVPTESSDISDPSSSSDPGPTPPQTSTASNQPTTTAVPQTESSPTADTLDVQPEGTTVTPDEPEVTTLRDDIPVDPESTGLDSSTVQENLETTTVPSSTPHPTFTLEATTRNPRPDTENNADDATAGTSLADDDAPTTKSPSTTEAAQDTTDEVTPRGTAADPPEPTKSAAEDTTEDQDKPESDKPSPTEPMPAKPQDTTDEVTPSVTTADPLEVTPEPTKSAPSEDTTKAQDRPDSDKPSPAKPAPAKPSSKPLDATDKVTPGATTADPLEVTPEPTKSAPSDDTTKAQEKPDPAKPSPAKPTAAKPTAAKPTAAKPTAAKPTPAKPTPAQPAPAKPTAAKPTLVKPSSKPGKPTQTLSVDDPRDFQGDDSNDTNLCSGRPIGAVTTLRNGTMVVFRGHYFWLLDRNRVPGPARGITQVWGVPSPIDTAFTRCNCQGKTYIFKGTQYWRFDNDVLDPNYPMSIKTGFDGLRGQITAALSVPQYRRRRESVYFFKRGGSVQKYTYQFGTNPTCRSKVQHVVYTVRNRVARQAVSVLGPSISIRTSWKGFPTTVTAAVSVPTVREPEGYKYYVFSKTKSYSVRMDSERPVVVAPPPTANAPPQSNDFIKCPKKV